MQKQFDSQSNNINGVTSSIWKFTKIITDAGYSLVKF